MFSGALTVRDRVPIGRDAEGRVTALSVFAAGSGAVHASSVSAGEIAKASGLEVQVGDTVGTARAEAAHQFPPPTLESVVAPRHTADRGRLRVALAQLVEGDPLINVRQDDRRGEISVSLYGEVQKEVVGETLARDYGVEVDFHDTTTICIERPLRRGEALEVLYAKTKTNVTGKSSPLSSNPFPATLGMRVEPARASSGIEVRVEIDVRLLPLHIYKTTEAFVDHMAGYVGDVLQEGLCGWAVTDCVVTVVDCGYVAVGTTAADYRKLTALVLMQALEAAGTQVCEPLAAVRLEVPADAVSRVLPLLGRLGAHIEPPASDGDLATIEASVPVGRVHELQRSLPHLTGGEGVLESGFAGYQPIVGTPPTRPRTNPNPLNRDEYLMSLARRVNA
jgi:ribosomal protection tetracycline resistance protein